MPEMALGKVGGLPADYMVYNLDLFTKDSREDLKALRHYYSLCRDALDPIVTTSCFSVWKEGKFRNGSAKVIPAMPQSGGLAEGTPVRIFFFDDNINLHLGGSAGSAAAKGICNLRDIIRGDYVDFSEGKNGFVCETAFRHTLIHHSTEYRNVMVQVNILDAMSSPNYFTSIIGRYAKEGEKLIVFMDVNGTILWDDSIMGLGPHEVILSAMCACIEFRPRDSVNFVWSDDTGMSKTVKLEKPQKLKQVVNSLSGGDERCYRDFWDLHRCERLIKEISSLGDIGWTSDTNGQQEAVSSDGFTARFQTYMTEISSQGLERSMPNSWFTCLAMLRDGCHSIIIQSFGMDTLRVLKSSVDNPRKVMQLAINHEMWSERDKSEFANQFRMPGDEASSLAWWRNLIGFDGQLWCREGSCQVGSCQGSVSKQHCPCSVSRSATKVRDL